MTDRIVLNPFPSIMIASEGTPLATSESLMHSGSLMPSKLFSSPLISIFPIFPALYNSSTASMRYMKNKFIRFPIRV